MGAPIEIGPGDWVRQCWTVEDWHGNQVVNRIFRCYPAAKRAMETYLRRPDADADVRVVTDFTAVLAEPALEDAIPRRW